MHVSDLPIYAPKGDHFQAGKRNLEALVGRAWNATKPLLLVLSKASAGRHLWNSITYENTLTHLGVMGTAWSPRAQFPKSLKGWSIKSRVRQVLRKSPVTEKSSLHLSVCSPLCTELIYLFLLLSLYLLWHFLAWGTTFFRKSSPLTWFFSLLPQLPLTGYFSRGSVSSIFPNMVRQYSAIFACCLGLINKEIKQERTGKQMPKSRV